MNKQQTMQKPWTATDRSVVDLMTKKTRQFPSAFNKNDSSDENSDLESVDSSFGPFVAIPKEFRPFPASLKNECATKSLNENKQILSSQNPIPVHKDTVARPLPKTPLLKTPKLAVIEERRFPNQNQKPVHKSNANMLKNAENLQKYHQVPNDNTVTTQSKKNVKNSSGVNSETPQLCEVKEATNKLPQARNVVLRTNETQYRNGIKYEYIGKQEHRTVKLNFEMPTKQYPLFNDGLKCSKQESEMQLKKKDFPKVNKNFRYEVEKDFNKETHTVLYRENVVKWESSLRLDKLLDDNRENERHFRKDPHAVLRKENALQRNNCRDESSSDNEDKIEWTIIQEKTITVSAKKIGGKNYVHQKTNDKHLPTKPRPRNRPNNPRKFHRKNNFHNNFNYQKNIPKHDSPGNKDAERIVHKNDLPLNNNSKRDNTEIRNSEVHNKQCSRDTETLSPECTIKNDNIDHQEVKNNKAKISTNPRKNTDDPEPILSLQNIDIGNLKLTDDRKESMLHYGREMTDLIIGSYSALSLFISMFNEWKSLRLELIGHFEYLEMKLGESSKQYTRYKDLLNIAKAGASVANAVPIPHVSIAGKVISIVASLFSALLSTTEKKKMEVEESNDISTTASRDTIAANDLYIYGLQCGQTFEETAKLMEEFHSNAGDPAVFEKDSPEIATFIRGVLEYRPRHRFFYKKLHKCFQELLHNSTSEFGKRLCEPLLFQPAAIDVIGFLDWRFRHDDFNFESVRFELEQIEVLINGKDTSINELAVRIRNCVKFLQDELKYLEGCVKGISTLFDNPVKFEINERWF